MQGEWSVICLSTKSDKLFALIIKRKTSPLHLSLLIIQLGHRISVNLLHFLLWAQARAVITDIKKTKKQEYPTKDVFTSL